MKLKISRQVLIIYFLYFLFWHFIPQVYLYFNSKLITDYKVLNPVRGFSIVLFPIIILILDLLFPKLKSINIKLNLFSNTKSLLLSLVYIILSYYYFTEYDIKFRQTGSGLSSDYYLILQYFLRLYFDAFLIFKILELSYKKKKSGNTLVVVLILISTILSVNSSLQILTIAACIALIFYPKLFFHNYRLNIYTIIAALTLFLGVFLTGIANKVGNFNDTLKLLNSTEFNYQKTFMSRISTMQISYIFYSSNFDLEKNLKIFSDEFRYTFDNIFILLGGEKKSRNDPWSINRLNHLNISVIDQPKAGTSPGFFGSFLMIFPFSLPLLLYKLYFLRLLSRYKTKFNLVTMFFLIMLVIYPIFISPLSLVNFSSNNFLIIILITAALYESQKQYSKYNYTNI
jgi:hypothetical protein